MAQKGGLHRSLLGRALGLTSSGLAPVDRTAAFLLALCEQGGLAVVLLAAGCGLETNGFVLRIAPETDASVIREAGPVDATAEEACPTCPRVIVLNDATLTPQPGGDGGTSNLDICPKGQVVIGYNGTLNPNALTKDGKCKNKMKCK